MNLIAAISDIHGQLEKLRDLLRELEKSAKVDVIVVAGDFEVRMKETLEMLARIAPVLFVRGNMDPMTPTPYVNNTYCIDNDIVDLKNMKIVGIGRTGFLVDKAINILRDNMPSQDKPLFVLSHIPPRGSVDCAYSGEHIGSDSLKSFVEEMQPYVVICGHVHESGKKLARLGKTLLVNVSGVVSGRIALISLDRDVKWIELQK